MHEGLQGAIVAAELLSRAGYDSWGASDKALLRAYTWLYAHGCAPSGDDRGFPHLINRAYGTSFAAAVPAPTGKNIGWLDWLTGK